MPTNTFEAIATTVVSGTSTNTVTFSGLNTSTYKNFIIIGSCRATGGAAHLGMFVNGISSYSYYTQQVNCYSLSSAFSAVPVSGIDNANSIRLSQFQMPDNSGANLVFRSTITNASAGRTNVLSECMHFMANNNSSNWTHSNSYINASLSSITIQAIGAGFFGNTSTFSIYGLV